MKKKKFLLVILYLVIVVSILFFVKYKIRMNDFYGYALIYPESVSTYGYRLVELHKNKDDITVAKYLDSSDEKVHTFYDSYVKDHHLYYVIGFSRVSSPSMEDIYSRVYQFDLNNPMKKPKVILSTEKFENALCRNIWTFMYIKHNDYYFYANCYQTRQFVHYHNGKFEIIEEEEFKPIFDNFYNNDVESLVEDVKSLYIDGDLYEIKNDVTTGFDIAYKNGIMFYISKENERLFRILYSLNNDIIIHANYEHDTYDYSSDETITQFEDVYYQLKNGRIQKVDLNATNYGGIYYIP